MILTLVVSTILLSQSKVEISKAPIPVQQTVSEQTKAATFVGLAKEKEAGKTVYELETKVKGLTRDLMIAPNGSILLIEEEINLADAPAPVQAAIQKQAGKLLKLESLTEGAKVTYEAQIENAKQKRSEFKFAADGSPIK